MPNKLDEMEVLKTSDFTLAATMLCLGYDIIGLDKTNPRRVIFYFRRDSHLESEMERYFRGEVKVNPLEFVRCQRDIRARIHTDIDI